MVQASIAFALNPPGPLRCPIQLATYRAQVVFFTAKEAVRIELRITTG